MLLKELVHTSEAYVKYQCCFHGYVEAAYVRKEAQVRA